MRKRHRILLALLGVGIAGLIASQGLREREPVYQGKPLSVWLERYDEGDYVAVTQQLWKKETDEAVRQIGTNAIPVLLRRLRAKDSPFTIWLMALTRKQHFIKITYTPARIRHREGLDGIEALGAEARRAAVPALLGCLNDDDREVRRCAGMALKSIDPEAALKAGVE